MTWYIYDELGTPQRLVFDQLLKFLSSLPMVSKSCAVCRAEGYGVEICDLDDAIQLNGANVNIEIEDLLRIANDKNQWFYDLDCYDENSGIRFGLHDSTCLFLEKATDELDLEIKLNFTHVVFDENDHPRFPANI